MRSAKEKRNQMSMGFQSRFLLSTSLFVLGLLHAASADEPRGKRHFNAKQAFNYSSPILFELNLAENGFDRLNISEDGRYRLEPKDAPRVQIDSRKKAVRFSVPKAPNSYRAEISLPSERGFQERWYGVRMFVPETWKFDPNPGADIVIQWHAVPGNLRPTYPNLSIAIQNQNWFVRRNFGSPQEGPVRRKHQLEEMVELGKWVTWIIHTKWSPRDDGQIQVWKDGVEVFKQTGPNAYGTIGLDYTPYLKTGIYHPEWNLNSPEREARYSREIPGIEQKQTLVSHLVVGSEKTSFESMQKLLENGSR